MPPTAMAAPTSAQHGVADVAQLGMTGMMMLAKLLALLALSRS